MHHSYFVSFPFATKSNTEFGLKKPIAPISYNSQNQQYTLLIISLLTQVDSIFLFLPYEFVKINKMSKKVIILGGSQEKGKIAFASKLLNDNPGEYIRLNTDELRVMTTNHYHTTDNEKFIEKVKDLMLEEALLDGKHVFLDDSNLSEGQLERIRNVVRKFNTDHNQSVPVEIISMVAKLEDCMESDRAGEKPINEVGEAAKHKMHRQHTPKAGSNIPKHYKKYPDYRTQDPSLPKAIICDLDGTLALLNGRSPFDASTCEYDKPNAPVVNLVTHYYQLGYKVILASGREDIYRSQTELWLKKYQVRFEALYMRPAGDYRKDAIVKKEIFDLYIDGKYYIELVLDDRNQVVDLWRNELQLPCFQVYYGDF